MPRLEILRPHGMLAVGDEIEVHKPIAIELVRNGIAKYIDGEVVAKKKRKVKKRSK